MDKRSCPECGRGVKSLSGLSRHRTRCPVLVGKETRVIRNEPRHGPVCQTSTKALLHPRQLDTNEESNSRNDSAWIDIIEDAMDSRPCPLLTHQVQSRLSTTASIRIELYEEVTGRRAGQVFDGSQHMYREDEARTRKRPPLYEYYPFQSPTDFAAAQWFLSAGCTKGDIERFFGDKRLEPMHKLLSFTSHDELMTRIHNIPYGIKDDTWKITEVEVDQETIGSLPSTYQIRYRDIVKVLEFLMGHDPFEHCLSYTPVRQFSGAGNDNRIYDEMHTADWWWRTQGEIPEGGTIIPILLATDKTMLSQHHGDESAWPIYVTIGNLDRATRRKQTVPGSVLLGFLPVTSETADDSKARVYHAAMELILERK
jgi:hypothetical protein